jgi:hypothetical protein
MGSVAKTQHRMTWLAVPKGGDVMHLGAKKEAASAASLLSMGADVIASRHRHP